MVRALSSIRLQSFRASIKRVLSIRNTSENTTEALIEEEAQSIEACIDSLLPSDVVEENIRAWVDNQDLMKGQAYEINLISGGYVNWAFHLSPVHAGAELGAESILVKYVKPDAKAVPGLSLDVIRIFTEAHGLKIGYKAAPDLVPRLISQHATAKGDGMVAMAFLPDRRMTSEYIFEKGMIIAGLGARVGAGLAKIAVGSSLASLGREAFDAQHEILRASKSVSSFMMDHVSSQMFKSEMKSGDNFCSWPEDDDEMLRSSIFENAKLLNDVKSILALMSPDVKTEESNLSLVHLDVWFSNLLVHIDSDDVSLIDFEFSCLGSAALDIGQWLQQLISAAITIKALSNQEGEADGKPGKQQRCKQVKWLLSEVKEAWQAYEVAFESARSELKDPAFPLPQCPPFSDVMGFCGMISLVRGGLSNFSLCRINLGGTGNPHCDIATRAQVAVGLRMLNNRHEVNLDDIISMLE